jgi:hypothetical protein
MALRRPPTEARMNGRPQEILKAQINLRDAVANVV